jgi:hypothetical protein
MSRKMSYCSASADISEIGLNRDEFEPDVQKNPKNAGKSEYGLRV